MIFPIILLSIPSIIWNATLSYTTYFTHIDMADWVTIILPNILELLFLLSVLQEDETHPVELKCSHRTCFGPWNAIRNDSGTYEQELEEPVSGSPCFSSSFFPPVTMPLMSLEDTAPPAQVPLWKKRGREFSWPMMDV